MAKIWKAELFMYTDGKKEYEYYTRFIVKIQNEEYKENKKFNEWISHEGWICHRISRNIIIEDVYGCYKAIQGFDHEPTKEEQEKTILKMKELMIKKMESDKENYLKLYKKKLDAINKISFS